jgi:MFS transporter, DHA1 family, tetracycline resistance protein
MVRSSLSGRGASSEAERGRVLRALQIVVFIDLLGLTLVLPVLPFRVLELGGAGLWLGVVLAGYSAAQMVAAPLLGRCADRFGRRRMLLLSLVGSTVSLAAMGFAAELWVLLAARIAAGLCGGSIGVAHALAADVSPAAGRTRAMARLGIAIGVAFTVGPLLGAAAGTAGFTTVALLGAGLAAAAWLTTWRLIPYRPSAGPRPSGTAYTRRDGLPWSLVVAGFAGMCALIGMEATVALLANERFAAGPGFVGLLLCVAGLAMTLTQAGPVGAGARRWGERRVAVAGAVAMAGGLAGLAAGGPPTLFLACVAVVAAGQGVLGTTTNSMVSRIAPPGRRGEYLGLTQAAAAAGRLVGPPVAGALYDSGTNWPNVTGAVLAVLAAAAVSVSRKPGGADETMGAHRTAAKDGT